MIHSKPHKWKSVLQISTPSKSSKLFFCQNCWGGGSGKLQLNIRLTVTWKHLSNYCLHMSRAYFKTTTLSAHPCQHIETNIPFVHCLRPADVSRNWSVLYVGTYFLCQLSGNLSQLCELLAWLFVLWCFHCLSPLQADKKYIYMCKKKNKTCNHLPLIETGHKVRL